MTVAKELWRLSGWGSRRQAGAPDCMFRGAAGLPFLHWEATPGVWPSARVHLLQQSIVP